MTPIAWTAVGIAGASAGYLVYLFSYAAGHTAGYRTGLRAGYWQARREAGWNRRPVLSSAEIARQLMEIKQLPEAEK